MYTIVRFPTIFRFFPIFLDHLATISFKKSLKGLSGHWLILGRLPFVITGPPGWSFREWNARVLRTERTCSGQTGPAYEVGPLCSFGPARNARSLRSDIDRQVPWSARAQTVEAICFLSSMGGLSNVCARLELTNKQVAQMSWMLFTSGTVSSK